MTRYPDAALRKLAEASYDDDDALKWLLQNGYPELAAVKEAIVCDEPDAITWLAKFHKRSLLLFVSAVKGSFDAVSGLLQEKEALLAATANAARGDNEASEWLVSKGFGEWAKLAEALAYNLPWRGRGRGSSISYGGSSYGGGGGGSWSGFGGGMSGGGGAGGTW